MKEEPAALVVADEMVSKLLGKIENRKSLHFNIKGTSHSSLRIECFKRNITMQDFFNEISELVESESPVIMSIMEDLSERKRNKQIEKLSKTDEESLYNLIEKEIRNTEK